MQYLYQYTATVQSLTTLETLPADSSCLTNSKIKTPADYQKFRDKATEEFKKDGYAMISFGTLSLLHEE